MGLSVSLSNALSGMNATQKGLDVLSRNVANAGTPGYHRQSISLVDGGGLGGSSADISAVSRAFNTALQRYYNNGVAKAGYAEVTADYFGRLEVFLGKPGSETSIDTFYQNFEAAMEALAVSPDDFTVRAGVISSATTLANGLNQLTSQVQGLRQETETQILTHVTDINRMLQSLEKINESLKDESSDETARLSLLDERDRLVAGISELVDVRVSYRTDDTVTLFTASGLGLLDGAATTFQFRSAGQLSANSKYSITDAESTVGELTARTPSGLTFDVVEQDILASGRLGALIELRDKTLVHVQSQLDEIASSLALSLNTVTTQGTAVAGPPDGFSIDLANMQSGNSFTVNYTEGGVDRNVRVVRVDDTSKLPMDYTDPDGVRVIGLDFSGGIGAVATALDTALGAAINVTNPAGTTLQIVDDGAGNTTDINSLVSRTTVTGTQTGDLALSLFMDGGSAYTNSLDGQTQKLGFAGRITLNTAITANNALLIQYAPGSSMGDTSRADFLLNGLKSSNFTATATSTVETGSFRLSGNTQNMIAQMLAFQSASITTAQTNSNTANLQLEAVMDRLDGEYGVNIDEEMARLIELQNAYAASARILSVVQELLDRLISIGVV